jgi:phosphoglycolate phosphatase
VSAARGSLPDGVVFDLDGTLVDSADDIAAALNRTLTQADLPTLASDAVKTMIGGGSRRLIERALAALGAPRAPDQIVELTHSFEQAYADVPCARTRVFPGAVELLSELAARQVKLGLCTNKPGEVTKRLLAALSLARYFGAVVTGSDGLAKKPDPAMLNAVLERLDCRPARSVMFGDSAADVGCGRAAGCPVLLVSFGYTTTPVQALGADAVIDSFAEALPALMRLVSGADRSSSSSREHAPGVSSRRGPA